VHLIGAGNSAGQAATFFANHARSVTLVVRGHSLRKSMSQYLVDQVEKANIRVALGAEVRAVHGGEHLTAVDLLDRGTGAVRREESGGLFVFIGADAETGWLPPEIARDRRGYVLTGADLAKTGAWTEARDPYLLETSVPGAFACGDVRFSLVKRVASAVGRGAWRSRSCTSSCNTRRGGRAARPSRRAAGAHPCAEVREVLPIGGRCRRRRGSVDEHPAQRLSIPLLPDQGAEVCAGVAIAVARDLLVDEGRQWVGDLQADLRHVREGDVSPRSASTLPLSVACIESVRGRGPAGGGSSRVDVPQGKQASSTSGNSSSSGSNSAGSQAGPSCRSAAW
jgi:hypothetical protein